MACAKLQWFISHGYGRYYIDLGRFSYYKIRNDKFYQIFLDLQLFGPLRKSTVCQKFESNKQIQQQVYISCAAS